MENLVVPFMSNDEPDDNPQIKEVLKALNHTKRRDILVYLKDLERATAFSELMDYLSIDSKTSGQFSYHLKLLLKAQLIEKEGEKYKISALGIKACSMLDMVDISEKQDSVVQKIASSYKSITPLDQVLISFLAFALISFFVPFTYVLQDNTLVSILITPIIIGFIIFLLLLYYSYLKLKYIPSILVLLSIIWVIFLQSDQIKTAIMYLISIFGIVFIYQSLISTNSSINHFGYLIFGILLLLISIIIAFYIIYKEYWKKEVNQ